MAATQEFRAPNWDTHVMGLWSGNSPFITFEDPAAERTTVRDALEVLVAAKILTSSQYDERGYTLFYEAVRRSFDIPWTGISPRMRRLLHAINSLHRPKNLVGAGVFCGYTFICNAGASLGPGACYTPDRVVGLEIIPAEAARAGKNVESLAPGHGSAIVCGDAAIWLAERCDFNIDLLYIDAKSIDFDSRKPFQRPADWKSEYLKILEAALPRLQKGCLVLAHNSRNAATEVGDYLQFVRGEKFHTSVNLIVDDAGLEVSML